MEYKIVLGYTATLVAFVGYVIYIKAILAGTKKPHAFSWLVWSLLTAIGFAAQVAKHGGAGTWVTGFTALMSFAIFVLALLKGKTYIVKLDWLFLLAALVSLFLWWATKQPTLSVILITITDALGCLPQLRKDYYKPHEDSALFAALMGGKFLIALFALESFSIATWLYPASLIFTNYVFVFFILLRRRQISSM